MGFSVFVFITLLKMALSLPEPDPNVKVGVDVKVDDQGSDCCNNKKTDCCPSPTCLGCNFGMTSYPDKAFLKDSCFIMQCIDGAWEYTGDYDWSCGKCEAWGEPHFLTFDLHTNNPFTWPSRYYNFQEQGQFILTQDGSAFGVKSTFVPCGSNTVTCIRSVTYYEPGIEIKLSLPEDGGCGGSPCKIKVSLNDKVTVIRKQMYFLGTVLIFEDNTRGSFPGTTGSFPVHCINIVGSWGLSVSLCSVAFDYGLLHIWAMPSLKNQLFGLCDTFTGTTRDFYTARNGSHENELSPFAESWQVEWPIPPSTTPVSAVSANKCANQTLLNEIQQKCYGFSSAKYELADQSNFEGFKGACEFDLCHHPDHESYAEGYNRHVLLCQIGPHH